MAYEIHENPGDRCPAMTPAREGGHGVVQCALAVHHDGEHVNSTGWRRWISGSTAGAKVTGPNYADSPRAGQKVTADNVSESVAAVLADRISAVAQRVESETPLREALASHLDQLTNKLNQEQHNRHRLADQVTALANRVTALEDRVVKLELPYGHVQAVKDTHNALVERIEKLEQDSNRWHDIGTTWNKQVHDRIGALERDLRDTHDLAERVATAHLERKPEEWNADSDEPSRLRRYQDSRGCVWEYSSSRYGWHWEKNPDDLRRLVGPFIPWDGLRSDRRADFPWKVWTNG